MLTERTAEQDPGGQLDLVGLVIRIELSNTVLAKPVAEFCLRMRLNVRFQLLPGPVLVADSLTRRADGEKPPQHVHFIEGHAELVDELLSLGYIANRAPDQFVTLAAALLPALRAASIEPMHALRSE
jgi:hypothetical protein